MNPTARRAHPFGPFAFGRAAVPFALFVYGLFLAQLTGLWIGAALAMGIESFVWAVQALRYAGQRPNGVLAGGAALLGILVALSRVSACVLRFAHWFALVPVWTVNRARWTEMRKARRRAIVEEVIEEAETMTVWARAMAALKVLRGASVVPSDPTKAEAVEGRVLKFSRRPA